MTSTHTAELPIPGIPLEARNVHIFPDMTTSLVGVTPLVQSGCTVQFAPEECTIQCPDRSVILCPSTTNGLWQLPLPAPDPAAPTNTAPQVTAEHTASLTASAGSVTAPNIQPSCTPADLVAFFHAALFSPATSTLLQALKKGFLPPFTGLTEANLRKHPPPAEATIMGHLDSRRKNIQSTKKGDLEEEPKDFFPSQPEDTTRSHYCLLTTAEPRHLVYSDQTGRLPHPSESGNNYLLVAYDYDSNAILLRPIKNRTADALTEAIKSVHNTLSKGGCQPKFHRMDNECPQQVKDYFHKRGVQYQLSPPDDHRSNAAERAIRTAKNHLAAGWYATDDKFPMYLWDKTIPQAELTLNLLRGSRINPKLSAWEQIHGRYDFNAHPIAPPGIKVLAHSKPATRRTWSTHAYEAWYVGPAMEHYRCYTVWAIATRQTRIVNQLTWLPHKPFPRLTSQDLFRATVEDLITILKQPPNDTFAGTLDPTQRGELIKFMDTLYPPASNKQRADTGTLPAPPLGVAPREDPAQSFIDTLVPSGTFSGTAINKDTGAQAEYKDLVQSSEGPRWKIAMCKELGRLFQGYNCPQQTHDTRGTDTCKFIRKHDLPPGKKPTYVRIVADYREHKADPYRVRCTVGGNLIDFPGDTSTKAADLVTVKCLINNIISTPGARAACIDIKDFYLNNPLPHAEYIRLLADTIPQDIWTQYHLHEFVDNRGYIYARVDKGMYGLPQAGKVASDYLIPRLAAAGYKETGVTPGLFKHDTNSIIFALVVDDFLVQFSSQEDLDHLQATLRQTYQITVDMEASKFCGMTLEWNYQEGHVTISMPGYIDKALQRFTHSLPSKPQHSPHAWTAPEYGARVQYADPEDTSLPLNSKGITHLQQVIGTLLFYARAVDNTMHVALGTLAAAQTQGTAQTMDAAVQLLNYAATHPDAAVRFYKSDMILYIHSDASYLSEPKARSRVGGYFYLGNYNEPADNPHPNGPIHVESRIMKNVMAAASEAEIGALFHNGQEGAHIRQILKELGREQAQPTRLTTDNSTADGFANNRTKIRRSKAMDMRFYWVQDRVKNGEFAVHWLKGERSLADYFTKLHPPSHHIKMRPIYLHTGNLAQVTTPDCRGVLIRDSGLTESFNPGLDCSQLCDSWQASGPSRRASVAV
jgi:hypothetical protein